MSSMQQPSDADLDCLSDEDLCRLVQQHVSPRACQVLAERYLFPALRYAARFCKHSDLAPYLRDDIIAEVGDRAITDAANKFDPVQKGRKRYCHFRTFLFEIIRRQVLSSLRDAGRGERRRQRSVHIVAEETSAERSHRERDRYKVAPLGREDEPSAIAAQKELEQLFDLALHDLAEPMRQFWRDVASAKSIHEAAVKWAMTDEVANVWKAALIWEVEARMHFHARRSTKRSRP